MKDYQERINIGIGSRLMGSRGLFLFLKQHSPEHLICLFLPDSVLILYLPGLECLALIQLSLPAPAVPFQPGPWVSLGPSPWLTSSQGCWCVPSRDHILLTQRNLLGLPGSCSHVERNVFLRYTSLQLSLQNTVESWALGQAYISLWNTLSHHSLAEHPRQCLFGE